MKKKQFEISTNDRVSIFIDLADAYRQLGQQVCTWHTVNVPTVSHNSQSWDYYQHWWGAPVTLNNALDQWAIGLLVMEGLSATVYQCLHSMAPAYLAELCLPITASAGRRDGLRSATTSNLVIPRCRLATYGTRAFSVAGPVCWNSLPNYLKTSDLSFIVLGSS